MHQKRLLLDFQQLQVFTSSCSSGVACVCIFEGRACANTNGTIANNAPCICGATTACTPATGLVCTSSLSVCSHATPCLDTSGASNNNIVCRCGSVDCWGEAGFCDAAKSQCHTSPNCADKHGAVANSFSISGGCVCGATTCDLTTGPYCDADVDKCSFCQTVPTRKASLQTVRSVCGTVTCDQDGMFCYAAIGQCATSGGGFSRTIIPIGATVSDSSCFIVLTSGTCTDLDGGGYNSDYSSCYNAARALDLPVTDSLQ